MKIQYFLGLGSLALLILLPSLGWAQTRTFHTPGGNITPGSEGQGNQNAPRGQNIRPASESGSTSAGSTTGGTSRSPSTFTTPGGSITPGSQEAGQNVREGTTVSFPRENVGERRSGEPTSTTTTTKGTSRIGPGIPTTPGERTTIDYKYKSTPQRGPSGQEGQNLRRGTIRLEGEYVGEHRQPRSTEVRSSTKGTSRIGPGISTSPAGRQTINVGGPQSVTGTSPKTGITVGAPVGTFKSGIEMPSSVGPKAGSPQAMPVGKAPGISPGMQVPTAPSGVSVPIEAPPPLQQVPSINVP